MRGQAMAIAATLMLAPFGAQAADLVVWWNKGFYEQEDEAVREIIAAFEQGTGKQVELVQPGLDEMFDQANAALEAGNPPDFLFPLFSTNWVPRWAHEDQLTDLEDVLGPVLHLFDADAIEDATMLNDATGQRALYALPMGRSSNHIHVWNSLLEEAGFTRDDIPGLRVFGPVGCKQCNDGYKGRVGIYQVMPVTEAIGRIILEGGNAVEIEAQSEKDGVWTLRRSALQKVKDGVTSLEEINRVTIET